MIVTPGTIELFFDLKKNPQAFTEGVNFKWGEYKVMNEKCSIISEGKTLIGTLNQGTDREFMIFNTNVEPVPNQKQYIAITWDNEKVKLYFNGKELHTENISDYL